MEFKDGCHLVQHHVILQRKTQRVPMSRVNLLHLTAEDLISKQNFYLHIFPYFVLIATTQRNTLNIAYEVIKIAQHFVTGVSALHVYQKQYKSHQILLHLNIYLKKNMCDFCNKIFLLPQTLQERFKTKTSYM